MPKYQRQQLGKIGEYYIAHKLLEEGHSVYDPLIDKEGVDFIIINNIVDRTINEIQVKTFNINKNNRVVINVKKPIPIRAFYYYVIVVCKEDKIQDFFCISTKALGNNLNSEKEITTPIIISSRDDKYYLQCSNGNFLDLEEYRNNFDKLR